jgi:LmbE family N-acetylglucosaminyl deacetylase
MDAGDVVFVHAPNDFRQDHRAATEVALTAGRH